MVDQVAAYEYRDSGVEWLGQIPTHWETWKIGHLLRLGSGETLNSEHLETDGSHAVYGGNGPRGFFTKFNHRGSYILVGRQGALCGNINYAHGEFWATEHALVVYPQCDLNLKWLGETLRHMDLNQYSVAAAQPGLSVSNITSLRMPVPTRAEQESIAKFLDYETAKIDALIEKQQQLIALLKEKRQAVISHAVTKGLNANAPMRDSGVEWLGEIPAHWEVKQIRHVTRQLGGGTPSKDNASFWDGEIPWVSPKDMKVDYISDSQDRVTEAALVQSSTHMIPVCSVLIVVRGMILDHSVPTALTTAPVTINQDMKALVPCRDLDGEFLLFVLKGLRDYLLSHTDSSAHGTKCLATDRLVRTSIALPELSEQRDLVRGLKERVARIDSLGESAGRVSALLQERRTALISAAVTGKIDVRGWKPLESKLQTEAA